MRVREQVRAMASLYDKHTDPEIQSCEQDGVVTAVITSIFYGHESGAGNKLSWIASLHIVVVVLVLHCLLSCIQCIILFIIYYIYLFIILIKYV